MSSTFEALKFLASLESGSSSPGHASAAEGAFPEAAGEQLATKADLEALRSEMKERLLALENDLRAEIHDLRAEIAAVRAEQLVMKWIIGFNLAVTAVVLFLLFRH